MGKNSKAKRDAKHKLERRRTSTPPKTAGGAWRAPLPSVDDGAFNRMARPACSECGSSDLTWMTAAELRDQVPEDLRARVQEGIDFLSADGQAWLCSACGGFGIMSGASGGFLLAARSAGPEPAHRTIADRH